MTRRLKSLVDDGFLSVADLAKGLGVSSGTVSNWLNGNRIMSGGFIALLPAATGLSGHWLLTEQGPIEQPGKEAIRPYEVAKAVAIEEVRERVMEALYAARAEQARQARAEGDDDDTTGESTG